ncbi:MAG: hypothetical protein N3E47_04710 [Candidatus Bathyarchaeota archaeon]|nr:hypothetical protein [Candidatus Bathyarchaeota archaeon]
MPSIEALTINEQRENIEEILEFIWEAIEYFPAGLWEEVNYIGNINMKHDLKVKIKEEVYNAFIFNNLIEKIRRIRRILQIKDLLLAVTREPIVAIYHRFGGKTLSSFATIVYDYVSNDVGAVSLFKIEENISTKIIAHGLGHNRGLKHHTKPIDIMHEGLLKNVMLENEGFCNDCIKRMLRVE